MERNISYGRPRECEVVRRTEGERFVNEALLPFLEACQGVAPPTTVKDLGGLLWGYQAGVRKELSPLEVADAIRAKIAELEQLEVARPRRLNQLVEALRLVDEAMPDIAVRFSLALPS